MMKKLVYLLAFLAVFTFSSFSIAQTSSLTPAQKNQLQKVVKKAIVSKKRSLKRALDFLEGYIQDADADNTKRTLAQEIFSLIAQEYYPSGYESITVPDDVWNDILVHLPVSPTNGQVLLLEFSDLECPFCARHHTNKTIPNVVSKHPNVVPVFFDFPLSFHKNAKKAAVIRQCIQRHAGYSAMQTFMDYAFSKKIDIEDLKSRTENSFSGSYPALGTCIEEDQTLLGVMSQIDTGTALGVRGTPVNILVDVSTRRFVRVSGAVDVSYFETPLLKIAQGDRSEYKEKSYTTPTPKYLAQPVSVPQLPVQPSSVESSLYSSYLETAYVSGPTDARITIVEFSDMECPYCRRHHENGTLQAVVEKYDGDVNVIFSHFPLSFHVNAQLAGEALECVGDQLGAEGFYGFKDALYTSGTHLPREKIDSIATEFPGLDQERFAGCIDSGLFTQRVQDHMDFGRALGVTGTPGNIVIDNTNLTVQKVSGAVPAASFDGPISSILGN